MTIRAACLSDRRPIVALDVNSIGIMTTVGGDNNGCRNVANAEHNFRQRPIRSRQLGDDVARHGDRVLISLPGAAAWAQDVNNGKVLYNTPLVAGERS